MKTTKESNPLKKLKKFQDELNGLTGSCDEARKDYLHLHDILSDALGWYTGASTDRHTGAPYWVFAAQEYFDGPSET